MQVLVQVEHSAVPEPNNGRGRYETHPGLDYLNDMEEGP